jgi:CubicO group peptidase (beta-lactamase class C family)
MSRIDEHMDGASRDAAWWRARLTALMARYKVPGAALGILWHGRLIDVASGVLSTAALVPATPDSVFQIGSITKVWTATLIMQLVDEGRLTLDTPVAEVLPGFRLADPDAAKVIDVRQLLAHTSGVAGDVFIDTGRGDDCVERYVARLGEDQFAQVHPAGATFSYCNAGYVVAGRIVEVLTGRTWDAALRERIIAPLGLTATVTLPEEAILHRAAVGHVATGGSASAPAPAARWVLPRCMGPAGLITARVHDLLVFARMHLDEGRGPDGRQILSAAGTRAMAEWQYDLPDARDVLMAGDSRALAWKRFSWGGHGVIGHSGGTIGQKAYLLLSPDENFAAALLTNGGDAAGLYQRLLPEVFAELTGTTAPAPFAPPAEPTRVDVAPYVGRYANSGLEMEVSERDGKAVLRRAPAPSVAERATRLDEPDTRENEMIPVAAGHFAVESPGSVAWESVHFYRLPGGPWILHDRGRAYPRVESPA